MTTLTDPFPPADVLHFVGRGGKTFDYIEDESVMDRLDECVGQGNWSIFAEPISVADGIVKVTLEALGAVFEDFGYQNREDGEALKEAVSDGIRRVGRMAGIGRYLYRKHDSPSSAVLSSPRPLAAAAPSPVSRPAAVNPYAPKPHDDPYPESLAELDAPVHDNTVCPVHGKPWKSNSRGYYCATKVGDGWCQEKPR